MAQWMAQWLDGWHRNRTRGVPADAERGIAYVTIHKLVLNIANHCSVYIAAGRSPAGRSVHRSITQARHPYTWLPQTSHK